MNIEFFQSQGGLTYSNEMVKQGKDYKTFSQVYTINFEKQVFTYLMDNLKSRAVVKMMQTQGITNVRDIIIQFKRCNWDSLDNKPDIDHEGNLFFEYVDCGYKGANKRCPFSIEGDPKPFCIYKTKLDVPNK